MSLLLYLIPNFLFLLALSYVPLPAGMPAHNVLASTLSRLTVIGTVILGALSGFGAIDTAWGFFPVFSRQSRCACLLLTYHLLGLHSTAWSPPASPFPSPGIGMPRV